MWRYLSTLSRKENASSQSHFSLSGTIQSVLSLLRREQDGRGWLQTVHVARGRELAERVELNRHEARRSGHPGPLDRRSGLKGA